MICQKDSNNNIFFLINQIIILLDASVYEFYIVDM